MSVFTDVKDLAEGQKKSKDWYREQLFYGLEQYTGAFKPGDIIIFRYSAATEKLQYWDTCPMVLITDLDMRQQQFSGHNAHYLRPDARKSICNQWAAGSRGAPRRCYHKYFMSNASSIYRVPKESLLNMTPLPVEQFVLRTIGRTIEVPSSFIWGRL